MQFNSIKNKYPKAWRTLEECYGKMRIEKYGYLYRTKITGEESQFTYASFYDFFDSHRIYIMVNYCLPNPPFDFLIANGNKEGLEDYWVNSKYRYSHRTKAEDAAFKKAFELLEEKLLN
jgi:hypothetical protein